MYVDISKFAAGYISVLVEKRMTVIKNRILKEKKEGWYDFEPHQIEMKICDLSDEYQELNNCINEFYKAKK